MVTFLFILAISVRLIPLHSSPLPYNIDGFPLARISELIIESGGIPSPSGYGGLISYNLKLPVFSILLSEFSLILGIEPLTLLPYFCALIGSISVVLIYSLTFYLTKNMVAAFGAGLFAALTGLFVYVTTAAMKQLLAIVLLILILHLYTRRQDWRARSILVLTLVLMPFTHHLTSLILLIIFALSIVATAFRRSEINKKNMKDVLADILLGPFVLVMSLWYYEKVQLEFYTQVINLNDVFLLISVFIIMGLVGRIISETAQSRPWFVFSRGEQRKVGLSCIFDEKVLILVIGIGVLYLNARLKLFTGGVSTTDVLLNLMLPYFLLAIIGIMGFNVLRYSLFPMRYLLVAMFLAPLSLMLFGMLRGFDIFSFNLVYRSYSFMDIPMAIVCGVGFAYVFYKLKGFSKKHRVFRALPVGALVMFFILCASTLPLAYENEEAFGIQEITYQYEFESMQWASDANIDPVISDQRYSDIVAPYFDIQADRTGPWRMKSGSLEQGDVAFISLYWIEGGAQMSTIGRVTFSEDWMDTFMEDNDVIYVGGPANREMVIVIVR